MAITQSKYEGDFFVFENKPYTWQGSELGVSVSAENTWRLPVRVGLIGGELGITVYRFILVALTILRVFAIYKKESMVFLI